MKKFTYNSKKKIKHGGNLKKASELYSIKEKDFIDFSSNINPLGIPIAVKKIINKKISNILAYPDPDCRNLTQAISKHYNRVIYDEFLSILFLQNKY